MKKVILATAVFSLVLTSCTAPAPSVVIETVDSSIVSEVVVDTCVISAPVGVSGSTGKQ